MGLSLIHKKGEMKLSELESKVSEDLNNALVSSKVLLQKFRLISETSRLAGSYADPRYTPFYYHLGKYVTPQKLLCVGFRLGMLPGCLLKSCESVTKFLSVQRKTDTFYSPRLGIKNVRDVYKGEFDYQLWENTESVAPFDNDRWDLTIVDDDFEYDQCRTVLDKIWDRTNANGLIVVDYLESRNGNAFRDFARIHNREAVEFKTRYRTGIVQR